MASPMASSRERPSILQIMSQEEKEFHNDFQALVKFLGEPLKETSGL